MLLNQIALDPANNVVIEACAGSGKTWLLVSRIVRLLLAGARPCEILAITFTRKAAEEMEERLRAWLRHLALAPDEEVREFLRERALAGDEIEAALPRARRLFEEVLTAQPGIALGTFHAWFLNLLRRAPLNAGVGGGVTLLEQTSALIEEAWQSFAEDLQGHPDSETAAALQFLFREHGLGNTRQLLLNFLARRAEWWAYTLGRQDPVAFALQQLRADLQVQPGRDAPAELFADARFLAGLNEYTTLLASNTGGDQSFAAMLEQAALENDASKRFSQIHAVLFTEKGELRSRKPSKAQEKRLGAARETRLLQLHHELGNRVRQTRAEITEQAAYRFNAAGISCGAALLRHYQEIKQGCGTLDYTDIEWRAFLLLNHGAHAEYMQYKLDARYRHILLDEFQDVNPLQWRALTAWLEASAAAGTRPAVFVVGDPKQAIYRFRRADARLFGVARDFFEREYGAHCFSQHATRRNAPQVLDLVNRVFETESAFEHFRRHETHRRDLPGSIAVLPLAAGDAARPPRPDSSPFLPLRNPLAAPFEEDPDVRRENEAHALAAGLQGIVGQWLIRDGNGERPAQYRDVMVLVKKRTHLAAYQRALLAAHIPFVSSRRGGLLDTLEARDLTALLEFLVAPFADLQLAQVLKSPLFACADADLIALAQTEEGNWWQRLQRSDHLSPQTARACRLLRGWLAQTDTLPVHDLLDRIYFEGDLLRRYEATVPAAMRAGVCANLHAFMEMALAVDAGRYPSLPGFLNRLALMRRVAEEEAPDEGTVGDADDAVHIGTVHGAKGLESPIVWLLDANDAGVQRDSYGVLLHWPPHAAAPSHFSLYGKKEERGEMRNDYFAEEEQCAARENLNLLYVAMTRARQALIVSGCASTRTGENWYTKAERAIAEVEDRGELPRGAASGVAPEASPPPQEPRMQRALPTGSRDGGLPDAAQRRGTLLHRLLELAAPPSIPAGADFLRARLGVSQQEFERLWRDAQEILAAPELRRFFDPALYLCAGNEMSYIGTDGEVRRMDRLVEFPDSVWVLDYKTGAEDDDLERCATPYRGQIGEYRAALRPLFPGKPVYGALIFSGGRCCEITD